ncbi:deoxycytidine triphosphate deaminase [Mycobacterium ulcerans str. Harvey]|uniref:Deoxycytidine triphosphate deaminase n=1 Tax=Mycobacterium ulcerans str. Harvey TaxID=1299332 RepID=A0ABP3AT30_MYCUL|nr:deoxycytidine triphosphate deaminase [Mycobacterium ulcerans str. Harvey]
MGIDPFDDSLVQPSSVDVRLDCMFRVFNNTRYTHIDPAQRQDELTSAVEPTKGDPFVLHPGEFVLGSTLEIFSLPGDLAGRLEGKSSLAGWACSPIPLPGSSIPASVGTSRWSCPTSPTSRSRCGPA